MKLWNPNDSITTAVRWMKRACPGTPSSGIRCKACAKPWQWRCPFCSCVFWVANTTVVHMGIRIQKLLDLSILPVYMNIILVIYTLYTTIIQIFVDVGLPFLHDDGVLLSADYGIQFACLPTRSSSNDLSSWLWKVYESIIVGWNMDHEWCIYLVFKMDHVHVCRFLNPTKCLLNLKLFSNGLSSTAYVCHIYDYLPSTTNRGSSITWTPAAYPSKVGNFLTWRVCLFQANSATPRGSVLAIEVDVVNKKQVLILMSMQWCYCKINIRLASSSITHSSIFT